MSQPINVPTEITEKAIKAAINFIELCNQQTAFMAGREDIQEEIQIAKASKYVNCKIHGSM